MHDPLFVAALLEGFEGTLDEVVDRVEDRDLRVRLDVLQSQVAALRLSIEKPAGDVRQAVGGAVGIQVGFTTPDELLAARRRKER